jgi:uncharacterized protein YueI
MISTYANMFVNTIQDAKSKAVKTMVTDEKIRAPLQSFIDAQTAFAREMVKITESLYSQVSEQAEKFTIKK